MSSKHLWRTNRDAKDSHLCLQNHPLSLYVSLVRSQDLLFILYICSLCAAWNTRVAVKDTRGALWVEHMPGSCRFLQTKRSWSNRLENGSGFSVTISSVHTSCVAAILILVAKLHATLSIKSSSSSPILTSTNTKSPAYRLQCHATMRDPLLKWNRMN